MKEHSEADIALAWRILEEIKDCAGSDVPDWIVDRKHPVAQNIVATIVANRHLYESRDAKSEPVRE